MMREKGVKNNEQKRSEKEQPICGKKNNNTFSTLERGALKNSVSSSLISISGGEELLLFVFARRFARALFFKEGENKRERDTHTERTKRDDR